MPGILLSEEVQVIVRELVSAAREDTDIGLVVLPRAWELSMQRAIERLGLNAAHHQACDQIIESILLVWQEIWVPAHDLELSKYNFTGRGADRMLEVCQAQKDIIADILAVEPALPYETEVEHQEIEEQLRRILKKVDENWISLNQGYHVGHIRLKSDYFKNVIYRLDHFMRILLGFEYHRRLHGQEKVITEVLLRYRKLLESEPVGKVS